MGSFDVGGGGLVFTGVITFIIAPPTAPQVSLLTQSGILHPLAGEVLNAMRQHRPEPTSLWGFINKLAAAHHPDHRARHRCWRLRYWGAIRELCRARLLFRHADLIATCDFAYKPKPRSPKIVASSVGSLSTKLTGSNAGEPAAENSANFSQPLGTKLVDNESGAVANKAKTKSARPSPRAIGAAASLLAMRPRSRRRKWTGALDGERIRRGTPIRLPNGDVVPTFAVLRGKVFVIAPEDSDRFLDRFDASQVHQIKNPAAVLLGAQKAGVKEQPSIRKQVAARANGCLPPREGSRPRGRPRLSMASPLASVASHSSRL